MTPEQIFYDDIQPGDTLPTLTVTPDERQLFFFSAATYNGHRIHYDKDWARTVEGYDDVIVQGPLQAALLARAVTDWIGGLGRLVEYSVQNRAVALAGQELTFGGSVTGKRLSDNIGLVDLDIAGRRGESAGDAGNRHGRAAAARIRDGPTRRGGDHRHCRAARRTQADSTAVVHSRSVRAVGQDGPRRCRRGSRGCQWSGVSRPGGIGHVRPGHAVRISRACR